MYFSESDYNGLLFNPHAHKGKNFLDCLSEFKLYQEFSAPLLPPLERNEILSYIIFVYDKESPFRKKYTDLPTRKYHSALEAGFELNEKGVFDAYIEEIFDGENESVNDMITAYTKMHYSSKWSYFVMMEAFLHTNFKKAIAGGDPGKISELKLMEEAVSNAQRELLGGDNTKGVIKSLYQRIQKDKVDYSPEKIAIAIRDGKINELLEDDED